MNDAQVAYLVEGILILASTIFGFLLGRGGKPYGKVKLVIHLFFSLWFIVGFAFILYGNIAIRGTKVTWIPDAVIGLMIVLQIISGIRMIISKELRKSLPMIHTVSTAVILLADIWAFIISGNPS